MTAAMETSSVRNAVSAKRTKSDRIKRSIFLSLKGLAGRHGNMRANPLARVEERLPSSAASWNTLSIRRWTFRERTKTDSIDRLT